MAPPSITAGIQGKYAPIQQGLQSAMLARGVPSMMPANAAGSTPPVPQPAPVPIAPPQPGVAAPAPMPMSAWRSRMQQATNQPIRGA